MLEEDEGGGEVEEGLIVFEVVFPADEQAAVVAQPGEESFDVPAAHIAAQATAILGGLALASATVRRDGLGAEAFGHPGIQAIAVISLVADELVWRRGHPALGHGVFHQLYFRRASAPCA